MTQSRLLPAVLLAASSWLLVSLLGSQQRLGFKHAQFCLALGSRFNS